MNAATPQGKNIEEVFKKPGILRVKCDFHPWMRAFIGVASHPYFDVTDADGEFELKQVPPGTYTVETWHELYGYQRKEVTVKTGETSQLPLSYTVE